MLPNIPLGPLVIPSAGLVYLLGVWLALSAVERAARRLDLDHTTTYGLAVLALAAAFVGARLTFAALYWDSYRQNPLALVWPLTSGYNWWGGLAVAGAAAFFYGRAKRLPAAATLDALTPGLLVGAIAVSLADFLAGPGYGTPSNAPWAIDLFGIRRHPVQVVALAALGAWHYARPRQQFQGQLALVAVAVFSAGRLFVDAFRANAWLTTGGYHALQIVGLAVLLASVFLLGRRLARNESPLSAAPPDEEVAARSA
jgi:prolipoprotein diacylglyceryltransferase